METTKRPNAGIPAAARLLCALVALVFASCSQGVVFDDYENLAKGGWDKDSLAVFRADIEDSVGVYDIWVQLRNDNDYAFSNLWLFIDVISPEGVSRRDTLECILARPDGAWIGSGWGSLYSVRCPYKRSVMFSKAGSYTFRITQGMRTDCLAGLHDIGLLIQQVPEPQQAK